MIIKKCKGCGAILQDEYSDKQGYVPNLTLETVYCKRCYEIMHHNATYDYSTSTASYYNKISCIKDTNSLISGIPYALKDNFSNK